MDTITSRRDVVKIATGVVVGAGLVGSMAPVEATAAVLRRDMAALTTWEDTLADASMRGESWVKQAWILRSFVQGAVLQAEETGDPALLASLQTTLAKADVLHAQRSATFQRWADVAWNLPDLAPLPAEPWASLPAVIGEDG